DVLPRMNRSDGWWASGAALAVRGSTPSRTPASTAASLYPLSSSGGDNQPPSGIRGTVPRSMVTVRQVRPPSRLIRSGPLYGGGFGKLPLASRTPRCGTVTHSAPSGRWPAAQVRPALVENTNRVRHTFQNSWLGDCSGTTV